MGISGFIRICNDINFSEKFYIIGKKKKNAFI